MCQFPLIVSLGSERSPPGTGTCDSRYGRTEWDGKGYSETGTNPKDTLLSIIKNGCTRNTGFSITYIKDEKRGRGLTDPFSIHISSSNHLRLKNTFRVTPTTTVRVVWSFRRNREIPSIVLLLIPNFALGDRPTESGVSYRPGPETSRLSTNVG